MAKFAFLLVVAVCGLLQTGNALGPRLAKRQACDRNSLPVQCQPILDLTIDGALFTDPQKFVSTYCGDTCGAQLYAYFDCVGSGDAPKFDIYCASNGDGARCTPAAFNATFATFSACNFTEDSCSQECTEALSTASDSLGCCYFSYFTVFAGLSSARALFRFCGQDDTELCRGGITNEIPNIPIDNIDPACMDLVAAVDQECRQYLGGEVAELFYYNTADSIEAICGGTCGPQVYQFRQECDKRTGYKNSSVIDVFCAMNGAGVRCGSLIGNLSFVNFDACEDIDDPTCPAECKETLETILEGFGCCLRSLLQVFDDGDEDDEDDDNDGDGDDGDDDDDDDDEDDDMYPNLLSVLCEVDATQYCTGAFSGERAPPPVIEDACDYLQQELPDKCKLYTSKDILTLFARADPTKFKETICDGTCIKPLYDYFANCDLIRKRYDAGYLDFLCSENEEGDQCFEQLANTELLGVLDNDCDGLTDRFCPPTCRTGLPLQFRKWGCCLFTFGSFEDNVTYIEDIADVCGLEGNAQVCVGGLTDKLIAAPGQQVNDESSFCERLREAIPTECLALSTYDLIRASSMFETSDLRQRFCDSNCAKPVYAYINECVNKTNAAYIDFLCSENPIGTDCLNIVSDKDLDAAVEGACKDATDKECSSECGLALQELSREYGCCLYTYYSFNTNVELTGRLFDQCGADNQDLCTGGISDAAVQAPGSDVEAAARNTVVSSVIIVVIALALSMLV